MLILLYADLNKFKYYSYGGRAESHVPTLWELWQGGEESDHRGGFLHSRFASPTSENLCVTLIECTLSMLLLTRNYNKLRRKVSARWTRLQPSRWMCVSGNAWEVLRHALEGSVGGGRDRENGWDHGRAGRLTISSFNLLIVDIIYKVIICKYDKNSMMEHITINTHHFN
jgi:hypothetical protein